MSKIKAVFFDLDGTLLPMDMDVFTNGYFKFLVKKAANYGYEPESLIATIWKGIKCMVTSDGTKTNEENFWDCFVSVYGEDKRKDKSIFDDFYANEFNKAITFCGYNKEANLTVKYIKDKGLRTVLATNPLFPKVATQNRIRWAGLDENDFEFYTCYEDCYYCKPSTKYYEEVLNRASLNADEVLMVGNDATEDLAAAKIGMKVFLLTDCLINKENIDISSVPNGSFKDLREYIDQLSI